MLFCTYMSITNIPSFVLSQLILEDVDSIVYVDSDILFLQPVDLLWRFLSDFNSSQLAAMAPEHEEPRIAWYNRFARHPFYGRTGINSGVMLMNLTRMRSMFFKVRLYRCITFSDHKMSSFSSGFALKSMKVPVRTSLHQNCKYNRVVCVCVCLSVLTE